METAKVRLSTQTKRRDLFLFNDICLITKANKGQFKWKGQILLEDAVVKDISDNSKYGFEIVTKESTSYKFYTKTSQERTSWIFDLKESLDLKNRKRVFAIGLEEILKRESSSQGIPQEVEKLINFIKIKCIEVEGLFRISPQADELRLVRKQIDMGNSMEELDLSRLSPHSPATLLKSFFRELPEPLMTFELYETFISSVKKEEIRWHEEGTFLSTIKPILQKLPTSNLKLLKYLIMFLVEVTSFATKNKMNSTNLSIVFGPTLLRPKVETIETSLEIPHVNRIVQGLIDFPSVWI